MNFPPRLTNPEESQLLQRKLEKRDIDVGLELGCYHGNTSRDELRCGSSFEPWVMV